MTFMLSKRKIMMQIRRLGEILDFRVQRASSEVSQLHATGRALSPQNTLDRGYAVLLSQAGKPFKSAKQGEKFQVISAAQEISATVDLVKERDVKRN